MFAAQKISNIHTFKKEIRVNKPQSPLIFVLFLLIVSDVNFIEKLI
jgi:hypothetical protein